MRNLTLCTAAALMLASTSPLLAAQQPTPPMPMPMPEQVQANPPGPGTPSVTPPNPETATTPVPPTMPADPGYQASPYKGALSPPPAEAMNKSYPLCTATLRDSCVNPGEAGMMARKGTKTHRRKHQVM